MSVLAPSAPGALGKAVDPPQTLAYLEALQRWLAERRIELDEIDRSSQGLAPRMSARASSPERVTDDLVLSWALWKACQDRLELLIATWDSGRVGPKERMRLSTLIWGRLDATLDSTKLTSAASNIVAGLALSLPEACRLSDALAGQLRRSLDLDPDSAAILTRLKTLRATRVRVGEQLNLDPPALRSRTQPQLDRLSGRVDQAVATFERGGDVGGLLNVLEAEYAGLERDLIVANATRREARGLLNSARELTSDLTEREAGLRALQRQCQERLDPAPQSNIPEVSALGPVPNTMTEIEVHLQRLAALSDELSRTQHALSSALRDREEVIARFELYRAKARSLQLDWAELTLAEELTERVLHLQPTPMQASLRLVAGYQALLEWSGQGKPSAREVPESVQSVHSAGQGVRS